MITTTTELSAKKEIFDSLLEKKERKHLQKNNKLADRVHVLNNLKNIWVGCLQNH